ncbi:unnamed protein product [Mytilus edulis]|uniref:Uncharacterized protein n=1 Tax=Mytilus edulis TaxID=6550 RepID=A0A8S3UQK0_MYTED|nr:unnamed protein product [Mytilus edulis]
MAKIIAAHVNDVCIIVDVTTNGIQEFYSLRRFSIFDFNGSIDENDKLTEEYRKTVNAEKSFDERKLTSTLASILSTKSPSKISLSKFSAQKDVLLSFFLKSIYYISPVTDEELQAHWTSDADEFRLNLKDMRFIEHVETTYVATLPMRAIGPLQWTKSKNMHQKEKNYQKASKKPKL